MSEDEIENFLTDDGFNAVWKYVYDLLGRAGDECRDRQDTATLVVGELEKKLDAALGRLEDEHAYGFPEFAEYLVEEIQRV